MLNKLIEEFCSIKEDFSRKLQAAFIDECKELFDQVPSLELIKWVQFTPYFNDGETCKFSVHEPVFSNCKEHEDVSPYGIYQGKEGENKYWITGWKHHEGLSDVEFTLLKEFMKMVQGSEMEEILKDMFDDGVQVTLLRGADEAIVTKWDHD